MDSAVYNADQSEVVVRSQGNSSEDVPCTIGPQTFEQANIVKGLLPAGIEWLVGIYTQC